MVVGALVFIGRRYGGAPGSALVLDLMRAPGGMGQGESVMGSQGSVKEWKRAARVTS